MLIKGCTLIGMLIIKKLLLSVGDLLLIGIVYFDAMFCFKMRLLMSE